MVTTVAIFESYKLGGEVSIAQSWSGDGWRCWRERR